MMPEEIRYILLSAHYRTKVNFTIEKQHEAKKGIQRIIELRARLNEINDNMDNDLPLEAEAFNNALDDDLDSPKALGIFFEWVRSVNSALDKKTISDEQSSQGLNFITYFDSIYSILPASDSVPQSVIDLANEREITRQNKEWGKADILREEILKKGWIVKDTIDGPKFSRI